MFRLKIPSPRHLIMYLQIFQNLKSKILLVPTISSEGCSTCKKNAKKYALDQLLISHRASRRPVKPGKDKNPWLQAQRMLGKQKAKPLPKTLTKGTNLAMTVSWDCHAMSQMVSRNCGLIFHSQVETCNNLPVI